MSDIGTVLKEYWGIVAAFVASIVWLVRLENRSISNEREIKRLSEQREKDLKNLERSQDQQNAMLVEMRTDIKQLLSRK
tara:strand:- start:1469 stop:1705 length:237 start_codon:yes stop_codon:yes gene_type:complete